LLRIGLICALACLSCSKRVMFEEDTPITVIGPPLPISPIVRDDTLILRGPIEFAADATISPSSYELLNQAAAMSKNHPEVKTIVIEGAELSADQESAVLAYLVDLGIAKDVEISYPPDDRQVMAPDTNGEVQQ